MPASVTPNPFAAHSLGPSCRLAPPRPLDPIPSLDGIPSVKAQFFYLSQTPIDDPLSAAIIVASADSRPSKAPLRPFSPVDNIALENAWLGLASDRDRRNHSQALTWWNRSLSPGPLSRENANRLAEIVRALVTRHLDKHVREGDPPVGPPAGGDMHDGGLLGESGMPESSTPVCCPELLIDASAELRKEFCAVTRRRQPALDHDRVVQGVMAQLNWLRANPDASVEQRLSRLSAISLDGASSWSSPIQIMSGRSQEPDPSSPGPRSAASSAMQLAGTPTRPPAADDGISGKPFVRVQPDPSSRSPLPSPFPRAPSALTPEERKARRQSHPSRTDRRESGPRGRRDGSKTPKRLSIMSSRTDRSRESVDISVGISRLHMVSLPVLQMKPIYWSLVNDISTVLRATWFYRDTMNPVDPSVANQLETGYRELRPWTDTWSNEVRCALHVGPLGEEKVSYRLWPAANDKRFKTKDGTPPEPSISSDPFCAARCFRGEAAAEGTLEPVHPDEETSTPLPEHRLFANHCVMYKDASSAFLLKPSLKPSAYYGRKPLAKIMKGQTVGIPVVRGFDLDVWERVHEKRPAPPQRKANITPGTQSPADGGSEVQTAEECLGCQGQKTRGQVTDLLLIVHGIGQKFAERSEGFHFTHAINGFRRAMNVELENPAVKALLQDGSGGIMPLPVNWRHLVSFEDGSSSSQGDERKNPDPFSESFGLKDIEPPTIPAVRGMVSDIMFDIPFYMSHHKPKVIAAMVGEANRVYRLWCRNNPGFAEKGRVHIIGHSLGSAMAIEVLSKQPSRVPRSVDPRPSTANDAGSVSTMANASSELLDLHSTEHFEFDTTNLFLLGSPAGFFLLLERGSLLPRYGRQKPGADAADTIDRDVAGDAGRFGCVAVDNVYNILAREDPIAYLLNGTIDATYAASLRVAHVPSTATSFLRSIAESWFGLGPVAPPTASAVPSQYGAQRASPDRRASRPYHASGAAGSSALARGGAARTTAGAGDSEPSVMTPLLGLSSSSPPVGPSKARFAARLPSQLELEVHDFTREETAEKRAFLLNDNGQVDWYLRSGGGPLEIQYLNMLSAHTSYWTNQDLIRMLCVEIGRRPGRAHTLPSMRAIKKGAGRLHQGR